MGYGNKGFSSNQPRTTNTRVGELRPSQILFSYGVGALIDLPYLSVMVMGLDDWDTRYLKDIGEERLLAALVAPRRRTLHKAGEGEPRDHCAAQERAGPLARELLDAGHEVAHLPSVEGARHILETFGRVARIFRGHRLALVTQLVRGRA